MKYIKLFESIKNDIVTEVKEILAYLSDDEFDIQVIEDGTKLSVFIDKGGEIFEVSDIKGSIIQLLSMMEDRWKIQFTGTCDMITHYNNSKRYQQKHISNNSNVYNKVINLFKRNYIYSIQFDFKKVD